MKKEVKNQKGTGDPKPANQAEAKTTALVVMPKIETLEELNKRLEAENQQLKAVLNKVPQTLEQKIEYFQFKQQKIKQLTKLEESANRLFEHIEILDELTNEDDFKCDRYHLSVHNTGSCNGIPVFTMNNPIIIRDVIKFVLQRINDKMDVLKMEIAD